MIVGVGVDIIEISRFKEASKKWGKNFIDKVFTPREKEYSRNKKNSAQHFAARFAAKEAVFKAFGDEKDSIQKWTDIEIINDRNGKPTVVFHSSAEKLKKSRNVSDVMVSMSHCKDYAVANAVLIGRE